MNKLNLRTIANMKTNVGLVSALASSSFSWVRETIRQIEPSASWTGTAGSGFGGEYPVAPSDPLRITAKPVGILIEPPDQHFTDELTVGVFAMANNGSNSLIGGIDRVRFHLEGSTVDVLAPTFRTLEREDGSTYQCLAYWVTLKKGTQTGAARLFATVIPSDATMQNRVIGPYLYHLTDTLYDWTATVGATGADYTTIKAAMDAAKTATVENGLLELIDEGDYVVEDGGASYIGSGYFTIRPAAGVSSVRLKRAPGDETFWRFGYDRVWFERIEFDLSTIHSLYNENQGNHVLRHCRLVRPGGRALVFKRTSNSSYVVRNNPWFLECYSLGAYEFGNNAQGIRGNRVENGYGDFCKVQGNSAVLYNIVDDYDWVDMASPTEPRLRITYSGSGLSVTLSRAKSSPYRRYVLKVDGTTVLTFDAFQNPDDHDTPLTSTGTPPVVTVYEVQDVADAINDLADFSATVLNNDIAASYLNLQGSTSASNFNDTEIISGTGSYDLPCDMDFHLDGWQSGYHENSAFAFNQLTNFVGAQILALADMTDSMVVGNIFDTGSDEVEAGFSRITVGVSHFVVAHNSFRGQRFLIGESISSADAYSFVSNNVMPAIADDSEIMAGANNVVAVGAVAGANMTGTVVAGSSATWYADPENLDFAPAGELLTNLKAPVVKRDIAGVKRGVTAPVGALA